MESPRKRPGGSPVRLGAPLQQMVRLRWTAVGSFILCSDFVSLAEMEHAVEDSRPRRLHSLCHLVLSDSTLKDVLRAAQARMERAFLGFSQKPPSTYKVFTPSNKRAWLGEVLRLLGLQLVAWELAENLKSAPPCRRAW